MKKGLADSFQDPVTSSLEIARGYLHGCKFYLFIIKSLKRKTEMGKGKILKITVISQLKETKVTILPYSLEDFELVPGFFATINKNVGSFFEFFACFLRINF